MLTEPEGRLTSEEAAKSWLRTVSLGYFKAHGIELSSPASGGSGVIAAISSAELEKIQEKHYKFIKQQIELFAAYIKGSSSGQVVNSKVDTQSIENLQAELDYWTGEHGGQDYYDGIKPAFAPLKVRRYDSWWNWARQEALQLYQGFLNGEPVDPNVLSCKMETIKNRSDVNLIQFLEWKIAHSLSNDQRINNMERAHLAKHFGEAMLENARNGLDKKAVFRNFTQLLGPKTTITSDGQINYSEIPRSNDTSKNLTFNDYVCDMAKNDWLLLRSHEITDQPIWKADKKLTGVYFEALREMATGGVSFANRTVLMTGCGRNSIGFDILKGLLMGGAKVIITTSSYTRKNLDQFQQLFAEIGGRGASLTVVPFNQASSQDIENLVEFIYGDELREDLDTIIPFAAISEVGRSLIDGIDARSELAHRMMLTNVLRLLGAIAKAKEKRGIITRPAQVILPLSPNHGAFGYDGLYGESKAALETLFQKWHSEAWQDYLTIVGAVIG